MPYHGSVYDASPFHWVRKGVSWRQYPAGTDAPTYRGDVVACAAATCDNASGTSSTTSQKSYRSLPLLTPPCRNRPFRSRASTLTSKPSQWYCCFPNCAASLITLLTAVLFGSNRPP